MCLFKIFNSIKATTVQYYIKRNATKINEEENSFIGIKEELNNLKFKSNEIQESESSKFVSIFKKPGGKGHIKNDSQNFLMDKEDSSFNYSFNNKVADQLSNRKIKKTEGKNNDTFYSKNYKFNGQLYSIKELETLISEIKFDENIYNYFNIKFYEDIEFSSSIELEFCCLLYKFIKLLEISFYPSQLKNFLSKFTIKQEQEIKKKYEKTKFKSEHNSENSLINTSVVELDDILENVLLIKFFNSITKTIEVERDANIIKVVFTINPKVKLISEDSKSDFIKKMPNINRHSKLTYIVNNSMYFVEEMEYLNKRFTNPIFKIENMIDYKIVLKIVFFITIIVNLIMLAKIDGTFQIIIWNNVSSDPENDLFLRTRNLDELISDQIRNTSELDIKQLQGKDIYNDFYVSNSTHSIIPFKFTDSLNLYGQTLHQVHFTEKRNLQIGLNYADFRLPHITSFGANDKTISKWKPVYGGITMAMVAFLSFITLIWSIVKLPLSYKIEKYYLVNVKKIDFKKTSLFFKCKFLLKCFLKNEFVFAVVVFNFFAFIGYFLNDGSWAFAFCLIIVINISETIKNFAVALVKRIHNIFYSFLFQLCVMYAYSNISFYYLSEFLFTTVDGKPYNLCRTLISCWTLTLDFGLRRHSGYGEIIPLASYKHEKALYITKMIYEVSYYIVVIVIIMNVIFGILIDTFKELRKESNRVEYEMENICLICGSFKENLEREKISFNSHTQQTHFIWNYVYYIIKMINSDPQDLNSINSYSYSMIKSRSINWIPTSCLELLENQKKIFEVYNENHIVNQNDIQTNNDKEVIN